jgi:LETM1 and EF-hand domain-containing protein 1
MQEALKRKLKARIEYAKFLQDTAKEMAKEVQTSRSGETKQTAEDLDEFLNKVSIIYTIQFSICLQYIL